MHFFHKNLVSLAESHLFFRLFFTSASTFWQIFKNQ